MSIVTQGGLIWRAESRVQKCGPKYKSRAKLRIKRVFRAWGFNKW